MPPRLSVGHQTYRAGKYLFTAGGSVWNVVDVSVNPPRLVTETPNRLGGSFPADHASQMLFSGNRIFVRTYTEVYSLGDPSQPMRLSAVHR
jgi:hypothetical protein